MSQPAVQIEPTKPSDLPALAAVHQAAFPTDLEARLVELLISHGKATISLKAVIHNQVVGHILFSPAHVGPDRRAGPDVAWVVPTNNDSDSGLGLAPLAVVPECQRQGIGAALVRSGLAACQRLKTPWVVVLGDPAYYGRFGFTPASRFGLTCEFGGGDAFQIAILKPHCPPPCGSCLYYAYEFQEVLRGAPQSKRQ